MRWLILLLLAGCGPETVDLDPSRSFSLQIEDRTYDEMSGKYGPGVYGMATWDGERCFVEMTRPEEMDPDAYNFVLGHEIDRHCRNGKDD